MADHYTWDLDTPHPNVEIDTLRVSTRQAFTDLQAAVDATRTAQMGVDDTYWLSDLLFSLVKSTLNAVSDAVSERDQLRADVDALAARVTALEPTPSDLEVP